MNTITRVVDERKPKHLDFISEFLNVITIVCIYISNDIKEKENIIDTCKLLISFYETQMKIPFNKYLDNITKLGVKNTYLFSAVQLIVNYSENDLTFIQLFDKVLNILDKLMKEATNNNNKDAIIELNHFYE